LLADLVLKHARELSSDAVQHSQQWSLGDFLLNDVRYLFLSVR
jgi:hypothetical protein